MVEGLSEQCIKLILRRSETDLLGDSALPQLRAERGHFLDAGMVRGEEPFFGIEQLSRAAMVERLHPARLQIHLDPVLQLRQRLPIKAAKRDEGQISCQDVKEPWTRPVPRRLTAEVMPAMFRS
jgi:hypothetical protein